MKYMFVRDSPEGAYEGNQQVWCKNELLWFWLVAAAHWQVDFVWPCCCVATHMFFGLFCFDGNKVLE